MADNSSPFPVREFLELAGRRPERLETRKLLRLSELCATLFNRCATEQACRPDWQPSPRGSLESVYLPERLCMEAYEPAEGEVGVGFLPDLSVVVVADGVGIRISDMTAADAEDIGRHFLEIADWLRKSPLASDARLLAVTSEAGRA